MRTRWLLAATLVATAGLAPMAPAAPAAAATPPVRWVAVSVATLWVRPGTTRPVDRPALTNPAQPRAWVQAMTVDQRRWLVGRVETQALYGTRVQVLGTAGPWTRITVPEQRTSRTSLGYPGWVPAVQLTATPPAATPLVAIVRHPTAWLWASPGQIGAAAGRVMELSYDTRLPVVDATATYVRVRTLDGRVRALARDDVVLRGRDAPVTVTRTQPATAARKMLGVPYLWGGTSGFAYDCSGLTYAAYHSVGMSMYRDADDQSLHGTAPPTRTLLTSDLVFFRSTPGGPVTHVAMYVGTVGGVATVIESPATGLTVRLRPLSAWPAWQVVRVRRYVR